MLFGILTLCFSKLFKKLKHLNTKSFVLYMSDHGEELFKDPIWQVTMRMFQPRHV